VKWGRKVMDLTAPDHVINAYQTARLPKFFSSAVFVLRKEEKEKIRTV
jgi:hypothetical protein